MEKRHVESLSVDVRICDVDLHVFVHSNVVPVLCYIYAVVP